VLFLGVIDRVLRDLDRHVVAHLRDVQTGEVAIYTGDREITVNDKRLAALLYKASR